MHYETGNFNGGVINANPGANAGGVGQRLNLSPGDIAAVNEIYPAEGGQSIDVAVDDGDIFLKGDGVNQWERPQSPV
jgi:hypothetical protein